MNDNGAIPFQVCPCGLVETEACRTCSKYPTLAVNTFYEVLDGVLLEEETRKAMRIFDDLGVSPRNEDGTCKSVKDVFLEAADKVEKLEKEANAKVVGVDLAQGESETSTRWIRIKPREE